MGQRGSPAKTCGIFTCGILAAPDGFNKPFVDLLNTYCYCGVPAAVVAFRCAKEVFGKPGNS